MSQESTIEMLRKKAVELNKILIQKGQQPLRDSELVHILIEEGLNCDFVRLRAKSPEESKSLFQQVEELFKIIEERIESYKPAPWEIKKIPRRIVSNPPSKEQGYSEENLKKLIEEKKLVLFDIDTEELECDNEDVNIEEFKKYFKKDLFFYSVKD